jgi:hypothetical protein
MNVATYFGPDEQVTKYERVIPRDLFNEAKLLKCMGRLALLILDGHAPVPMFFKETGGSFIIRQLASDGALVVVNYPLTIKGKKHFLASSYNSKNNYPLYLRTPDFQVFAVFDNEGNFHPEFIEFCKNL